MSNPHLTDHDKPLPLGPPTKQPAPKPADPVWKDLRGSPGYVHRVLPNGSKDFIQPLYGLF